MRIALDTNVLVYAEAANGALMRDRAMKMIQRLPPGTIVLPAQTLGELFNVLVRKAKRSPSRAREAVLSWRDAYPVIETSAAVIVSATDLAADHRLTIWDSVVQPRRQRLGVACFCRKTCKKGLLGAESRSSTRLRPLCTPSWRRCSLRSRREPVRV